LSGDPISGPNEVLGGGPTAGPSEVIGGGPVSGPPKHTQQQIERKLEVTSHPLTNRECWRIVLLEHTLVELHMAAPCGQCGSHAGAVVGDSSASRSAILHAALKTAKRPIC
jgi:hypothetical protein